MPIPLLVKITREQKITNDQGSHGIVEKKDNLMKFNIGVMPIERVETKNDQIQDHLKYYFLHGNPSVRRPLFHALKLDF
jgi:hypothetical protein